MASSRLPEALQPFCITQKYDDLMRIIHKRYGKYHGHQIEDLVQIGAMHYQQWLHRIDLNKIHDPFTSAVKIACWQVENYLKKERLHENGIVNNALGIEDKDIRYAIDNSISRCDDIETELATQRAINALIETRNAQEHKHACDIDCIVNDEMDEMTYYKRKQTKALMKSVIYEYLD